MIVGLTGTGLPFPRLVRGLADYARRSGDSVWVQHGAAALVPPLEGVPILPRTELLEKLETATVIVSHGGSGSIADAFRAGRVPVIVPRLASLGEHVNDHQLELVEVLGAEGRIVAVQSIEELPEAIEQARSMRPDPSGAMPGAQLRESLEREVERRKNDHSVRSGLVWGLLRAATWLLDPTVHLPS